MIALILLSATLLGLVISSRFGGGVAAAAVAREPVSSPGPDPFMPPVGSDIAGVESPDVTAAATTGTGTAAGGSRPSSTAPTAPNPTAAGAGQVSPSASGARVAGGTPGLYGGTRNRASCNPGRMVDYLRGRPALAATWAGVLGIPPARIGEYVNGLTPLVLRLDTVVTNHGFSGGQATSYPAVLQAGTAVLVDRYGAPVTKCFCGNPLTPPQAFTHVTYVGPRWSAFRPAALTVVERTRRPMASFTLVEPTSGGVFVRPSDTNGTNDQPPSPALLAHSPGLSLLPPTRPDGSPLTPPSSPSPGTSPTDVPSPTGSGTDGGPTPDGTTTTATTATTDSATPATDTTSGAGTALSSTTPPATTQPTDGGSATPAGGQTSAGGSTPTTAVTTAPATTDTVTSAPAPPPETSGGATGGGATGGTDGSADRTTPAAERTQPPAAATTAAATTSGG